MSVTSEKLERTRERLDVARKENVALVERLDGMKRYFESYLLDKNSNTAIVGDDLVGGFAGWGFYRGASALYGWLAKPKDPAKPNVLARNPWISDAAQATLSAAIYAANLTIKRNDGEELGPYRQLVRRSTTTTLLFAVDSLCMRGYRALQARAAKKQLEQGGA